MKDWLEDEILPSSALFDLDQPFHLLSINGYAIKLLPVHESLAKCRELMP